MQRCVRKEPDESEGAVLGATDSVEPAECGNVIAAPARSSGLP